MPTTHVEPGSEALLEEIANSLWKSKKVVVITGAGISTNSGIPDFRSENGLYSLIQAQFDAAEKQQDHLSSASDASDSSSEERPTKRRRASHDLSRPIDGTKLPGQWPHNTAQNTIKSEKGHGAASVNPESSDPTDDDPLAQPATPRDTSGPQEDVTLRDVENSEHAPGPPTVESANASFGAEKPVEPPLSRGLTPLPSPRLKVPEGCPEITPGRIMMGPGPSFTSSPPSMPVDAPRLRSRTDMLAHTRSSSPLSSPPPISYDPYQESPEGSSCSSSGSSSRSESEEPSSVSTPLLTSQTSYASSGRMSLPHMKGKDLFDSQIWSCPLKTSVFYTFATTLRNKVRTAQPTNSHRFVSVLRDSRKLVRCYTQNIDQLEERVGLSTSLTLGAGSRYRFSARAGRSSAVSRSLLKGPEVSDLSGDGCSQQDSEQPPASQTELESQELKDESGSGEPEGKQEHDGSGSDSSQAVPSSSQPPSSQPAPSGPKRGVECVFLHGSLAELRCFVCAKTATWEDEERQAETLAGRQPTCPHCAGATAAREEKGKRALGVGKLRPDIVLYGEEHPHAHLISPLVQHDLSLGPDMLLILGTSMRVHGLKVLVREFAKAVHDRGGKVVFVNFTKPPESVWADVLDFWVQWDCDAWVEDLQHRKPALWLPPGTVLPDQVKVKGAKGPRRQSGGETGKRKEPADTASKKRKEVDGPNRKKQKREIDEVADSVIVALDPADVREPSPPPALEVPIIPVTPPVPSPSTAPPVRPEVVREIPRLRPEAPPRPREMAMTTDRLPPPIPLPGPSPLSMSMTISPPPKPTRSAPPSPPAAPVIPELKPIPRRPANRVVTREPKLNPDAKRPASIRDHKLNGAYLTFKILGDLKRITGEPPVAFYTPSPSPVASRPKSKRARKSAPSALQGVGLESVDCTLMMEDDVEANDSRGLAHESSEVKDERVTNPMDGTVGIPDIPVSQAVSSISAMVKSRRRKRTAWRMIRGVETQVSLDDNGEVVLPLPLPHTAATFRPLPSPSFRALPEPRPTPVASPVTCQPSSNPFASIENGFQDTDRLIDKLREQSRPSTPLRFQFPPLNIPAPTEQSPPKLETLEPKVTSPGPLTANNVMSPIFAKPRNPFFFADPLAGGLAFPPTWHQHQFHHHQATTSMERTTSQQSATSHQRRGSWNPEDQLQQEEREREVAMMLTMMSNSHGMGYAGV